MAPTPDPPPTAPAAGEAPAAPRRSIWATGLAKFSDNAVPSLVVAIVVGLVMFNLNQTNDRITRLEATFDARLTRLEENQQEIAVALATLAAQFAAFEKEVDARFAAIDTRFGAVDARFAAIEARFAAIDARFGAVEAKLTKLDENQQEIAQTLARLVALIEAGDGADGL